MNTRIDVKAGETGVVRVFATDLGKEQIGGFDLQEALGAAALDPEKAELFDIGDLSGLGLAAYLMEGYGIPDEQLAGMTGQLDGLKGVVLILPSRAMEGIGQTLSPSARLRLVGTFFEEVEPIRFEALPSEAAQGNVNTKTKSPPSRAAVSGRVAMVVLALLAGLVALMTWIAG